MPNFFAEGSQRRYAAAGAAHEAIAPSIFALGLALIFFVDQSVRVTMGALSWPIIWTGVGGVLFGCAAAVAMIASSLVLSPLGEQAATDEKFAPALVCAQLATFSLIIAGSHGKRSSGGVGCGRIAGNIGRADFLSLVGFLSFSP